MFFPFQDEDLQEMITESEVLEDSYGHLFDLTVVNKDLEPAYSTILEAVDKLQQQPQWVPVDWTQDKWLLQGREPSAPKKIYVLFASYS